MPLPANSPYLIPRVICSACGSEMRVEIHKFGKGLVSGATGYCDGCKYGWVLSMQYATGQNSEYKAPMAKDVAPFVPAKTSNAGVVNDGAPNAAG